MASGCPWRQDTRGELSHITSAASERHGPDCLGFFSGICIMFIVLADF